MLILRLPPGRYPDVGYRWSGPDLAGCKDESSWKGEGEDLIEAGALASSKEAVSARMEIGCFEDYESRNMHATGSYSS